MRIYNHDESKLRLWVQRRLAAERDEVIRLRRLVADMNQRKLQDEAYKIVASFGPMERKLHRARASYPEAPTLDGRPVVDHLDSVGPRVYFLTGGIFDQ